MPRPRPAGTHEEPDLASWASAARPDAASSRGPVLPPASRRPSAAHLAQASGGSAGSKLRNCHGQTAASGRDLSEVLLGSTSRREAFHASGKTHAGPGPSGAIAIPSGKCSPHQCSRILGSVVLPNCLPGEARLSLSHAQTYSELVLVLPGPLGRGFLVLPRGNRFARIVSCSSASL